MHFEFIPVSTTTEEIKNRLDIVEFIAGYLRLQKAGRNFRALCPFHNEKSPSFMVSSERQLWHCFGCGESGDIFSFLMKIEGVEFKDALAQLAQRAGVRLEKFDGDNSGARQRIYQTLEIATQFYEHNLWGPTGAKALQYIIGRGVTNPVIKNFRVGYSLDSWDSLLKFMTSKGFSAKDLLAAGLVVQRENTSSDPLSSNRNHYDRFRHRIMFPISDISGKVVGFSARVMPGGDDKMGKYINTPETLVYNKSRVMYALDKAKLAIRKNNFCIMVEGQLDVIMSHQVGIKNVVATSGTALTADHLVIVKRYTKNLALCFDSDEAGSNATKRAIDLSIAAGMNTKIIILQGGKDPADIIKHDTRLWVNAITQKRPVINFYFDNVFSRYNSSDIEHKKKIADELLPVIKLIPNPIERADYLRDLALRLKVEEKTLEALLQEVKDEPRSFSYQPVTVPKPTTKIMPRIEQLGEFILGVSLLYPERRCSIIEKIPHEDLFSGNQNIVFRELKRQGDNFALEQFIRDCDESLKKDVDLIIFKTEQNIEQGNINPAKVIDDYIWELKRAHRQNRLEVLTLEIKHAESKRDITTVKQLSEEFRRISQDNL